MSGDDEERERDALLGMVIIILSAAGGWFLVYLAFEALFRMIVQGGR